MEGRSVPMKERRYDIDWLRVIISFPTILVLYELFVRHIGFMRFLFGMVPQKKQPTLEKEDSAWRSKSQSLAQ
jgi:hypothetical protein